MAIVTLVGRSIRLGALLCAGCQAGGLTGVAESGDGEPPPPQTIQQPASAAEGGNATSMPADSNAAPSSIPTKGGNPSTQPSTIGSGTLALPPACTNASGHKVAITNAAELTQALQAAQPGDVLILADGNYQGSFTATAKASATSPIALCGSPNAVLEGPDITTSYTLHLNGTTFWEVAGITVSKGAKGIMLDNAGHNTLTKVTVVGTGAEGIHLRTNSSDNIIDGCVVSHTGLGSNPMFGEGIYIGSSKNNWCTLTGGLADKSDRNTVQNCTISNTTAEAIDVKEGTSSGTLRNNALDGADINMSAATSIINLKGNSYTVTSNAFTHAPVDAISIHVLLPGWGACHVLSGNSGADALPGYGIHMAAPKPWPSLQISSDNSFPAAASGMTNAPVGVSIDAASICTSQSNSTSCGE